MKTNLKTIRLNVEEAVSLIKDDDTGVKVWRHRYFHRVGSNTANSQRSNDYPYKKFADLLTFKDFIEEKQKKERAEKEKKTSVQRKKKKI